MSEARKLVELDATTASLTRMLLQRFMVECQAQRETLAASEAFGAPASMPMNSSAFLISVTGRAIAQLNQGKYELSPEKKDTTR